MPQSSAAHSQDIRNFLAGYRAEHPDDVLTFKDEISADQDIDGRDLAAGG